MDTSPSSSYKGFDFYPVVYRLDPPREWYERRPDRSYSASVVICREGQDPASEPARKFPLRAEAWEDLGAAERAAVMVGHDIVDGLVDGQDVSGM